MGQLFDAIKAAESIKDQMHALSTKGDESEQMEVVRLRARYGKAMSEMLTLADGDFAARADAPRRAEFNRLFSDMRSALMKHQSQWLAGAIAKDPAGYKASATEMNGKQTAFYSWARTNLQDF